MPTEIQHAESFDDEVLILGMMLMDIDGLMLL